ncbi:hypothetical protein B0H14DRAFT_3557027 [Mycena olivaceomarginata]|nr:hypothetical protein B0H14DRAFT_3557027 [Mycena olivaceomarginata]
MPTARSFVHGIFNALYNPCLLLPPTALGALIQLWRKYDYTNVLAAVVARITHINPTTLDIVPHRGLSSNLTVLVREHGFAAALPATYYHTLVAGNNNSLLLDGLMHQDGTHASLPSLDLRRCLIGHGHLLVKQFQPGYTLGWLLHILPLHGVGLHKLDKACQMLCGTCEGGCRGDGDRAQEGAGGVPGIL